MSDTIDTKVAQLKFDNSQFERGINDSIKDVDKLNKSLKLDQATDGINSVSKAIKGLNFNPITDGIVLVTEKFSYWEQVAVGAARRVGDNITNYVVKTFKELSGLNNLTAGYEKYTSILDSTNILASAVKDSGKTIEDVENNIDKLRWYSDETSYSLSQMTDALSKFVNAGIDIDDASTSIQGIASWAAISGTSVEKASGAFYNLSQAMGTGYLGLMDWKSLENLSMGTMAFKEMAIAAGVATGQLKDLGNGIYETLDGTEVTVNNFRETLNKKWLDSNTLNQTLTEYGKYSIGLQEFMNEHEGMYSTARDAMEDFDEELKAQGIFAEYEMSKNAFIMGQEAKNFSEAIDATKDAASSAWYSIIKSIIGDLDEAKELWGNVTDELYTIFVDPLNALDYAFSKWKEAGGRDELLSSLGTFYEGLKSIAGAVSTAFSDVFESTPLVDKLLNATKAFTAFVEKMKSYPWILQDITKFVTIILQNVKYLFGFVKPLFGLVASIVDKLMFPLHTIVSIILNIGDILSGTLRQGIDFLINGIKSLKKYLPMVLFRNILDTLKSIFILINSINTHLTPIIKNSIGIFFKAIKQVTGSVEKTIKQSSALWQIFRNFHVALKKIEKVLGNFNTRLLRSGYISHYLTGLASHLGTVVGNFIVKVWPKINSALTWIFKQIPKIINVLKKLFSLLKSVFKWLGTTIVNTVKDLHRFIEEVGFLENIGDALQKAGGKIKEFFSEFNLSDRVSESIQKIKDFFSSLKKEEDETDILDDTNEKLEDQITLMDRLHDAWENLKTSISNAWTTIKEKASGIYDVIDENTGGMLTALIDSIKSLFEGIKSGDITIWDILLKLLTAKALFHSIISLVEMIKNPKTLIGTLKEAIAGLGDATIGILDSVSEGIDNVTGALAKSMKASVFKKIATAILMLAAALLIMSNIDADKLNVLFPMILGFMLGLGKVAKEFLKGTSALSDATGGLSEAKALKNISKTFTNIAKAVLILVAALWVASKIDEDKAKAGLSTIVILMIALKSVASNKKGNNFGDAGKQMKQISKALLILTAAVFLFGSMDSDKLAAGLIAVIVILKMFEAFLNSYNRSSSGAGDFAGVGKSFKQLSKALIVMFAAVYLFGTMPLENVISGVVTIGVLLLYMAGIYTVVGIVSKSAGADATRAMGKLAKGFVGLSLALLVVAAGMALIGNIPSETLISAGSAMGMILLVMSAVYAVIAKINSQTKMSGMSFAMIVSSFITLSAAVLIISAALLAVSGIQSEQLITSASVMGMMLLVMAAVYAIIGEIDKKVGKNVKISKFIGLALAMTIMSTVLTTIATNLALISKFPIEEMITSAAIMMGMLVIMTAIMAYMSSKGISSGGKSLFKLSDAVGFIALALAIRIISEAMMYLGKLGGDIVWPILGVFAIVAALVTLSKFATGLDQGIAVLFKFFTALSVGLVGAAAAILLIAIAVAIFAGTLEGFANGLAAFAKGGDDMKKGAKILGEAICVLIVDILTALGLAIVELCRILVKGAIKVAKILLKGIKDILHVLNAELPGILEELSQTIAIILAWISGLLPGLLAWLSETIHTICDWLIIEIPIIFGYLSVIIPELAEGVCDMILQILIKVTEYINKNRTQISEAIWNFIVAVFKLLWEVLTGWGNIPEVSDAIQSMFAIGDTMFTALGDGMKLAWDTVDRWLGGIPKKIASFVADLWDAITYTPKDWDKLDDFFKDTRVRNMYSYQELGLFTEALKAVGNDFKNDTEKAYAAKKYIDDNQYRYTGEQYDKLLKVYMGYISYAMSEGKDLPDAAWLNSQHFTNDKVTKWLMDSYAYYSKNPTTDSYWDQVYSLITSGKALESGFYKQMDSELAQIVTAQQKAYDAGGSMFAEEYGIKTIKDLDPNGAGNRVTVSTTTVGDITFEMTVDELKNVDSVVNLIMQKVDDAIRQKNASTNVSTGVQVNNSVGGHGSGKGF